MKDKALAYHERFDRRLRDELRGLADEAVVEEHRVNPLGARGPQSERLRRLLNYFRRAPQAGKYVVVAVERWRDYRIGVLSGVRGAPPTVLDGPRFATEEDALHGVFLARVRDLVGEPEPGREVRPSAAPIRPLAILGYTDSPSAAPGERIRFHVSAAAPGTYRADVVRLVCGDTNPAGPGFKEAAVDTPVSGEYPARFQPIRPGSHVVVDDAAVRLHPQAAFTVHARVFPTTPAKGAQAILSRWSEERRAGWALGIGADGRAAFVLGDGAGRVSSVVSAKPLLGAVWYSIAAGWDPAARRAWLSQRPVVNAVNSIIGPAHAADGEAWGEAAVDAAPADAAVPVVIAGRVERLEGGLAIVGAHFNGKVDAPKVYGRALDDADVAALHAGREVGGAIAAWDFAAGIGPRGIATDRVVDASGNGLDGVCVNSPTRAVTGARWRGVEEDFRSAPEEYGAIHFHDDDLDDCRWDVDFELVVPDTLRSGVYAARLRLGESEDHVPFFVLPPRGRATARILFVAPTASYLAYANDRIVAEVPVGQAILGHTSVLDATDFHLCAHPELGLSTYDHHSDGSGVSLSSWRRPILTMRPRHRHGTGSLWQFPADLHLVDWLEAKEFPYDVATDHDLEREGIDLLRRYAVVLTGTHPEYSSARMLDAYEGYVASGGRVMYLGANGFYWITSFHPEKPWLVEVRKAENGSRAWQASPGEYRHATSGERGGIWRNRARPPQKIFGVGFTAEGFDRSSHYVRMPDGLDPRAAWIFEGVERPGRIGDFGLIGGGAAGHELDRYDLALGTPPNALLLASSEGHSDDYPHVVEEIMFAFPGLGGTQDPQVRADVVYFTTPAGGAVFSVGSIAWCGSLAHAGYRNDVSRITENVLRRFAADGPLPG